MSDLTLTKIRFRNGKWEGKILNAPATGLPPQVEVLYQDRPVDGIELNEGTASGEWDLVFTIPVEAIAEGVQTFVISEAGTTGQKLGSFSLVAGDPIGDDLRVEIELLRAELDMLKRAFRRHCLETA